MSLSPNVERALRDLARAVTDELGPPDPPTPPELIDIPTAARRAGVSRATFYRLLEQGQVRSVKVFRRRLIPSDAIAEFIADREREASSWPTS